MFVERCFYIIYSINTQVCLCVFAHEQSNTFHLTNEDCHDTLRGVIMQFGYKLL